MRLRTLLPQLRGALGAGFSQLRNHFFQPCLVEPSSRFCEMELEISSRALAASWRLRPVGMCGQVSVSSPIGLSRMPTVERAREREGERLRFSTAKNYHSGPTERTAILCSVAHSDRRYISFLESGFGDFSSIHLSKKEDVVPLLHLARFWQICGYGATHRARAFNFTDYCYDFTPSNIRMTMLEVFPLSKSRKFDRYRRLHRRPCP